MLVVVDQPVPDKRHAGSPQERADDLTPDVARDPRPREAPTKGQGQGDRRVQMRPRDGAARVYGKGDGESPEESRSQQPGKEAVLAASDGVGDEAIPKENEDEDAEDFAQVLFSPTFFRYGHVFLLL